MATTHLSALKTEIVQVQKSHSELRGLSEHLEHQTAENQKLSQESAALKEHLKQAEAQGDGIESELRGQMESELAHMGDVHKQQISELTLQLECVHGEKEAVVGELRECAQKVEQPRAEPDQVSADPADEVAALRKQVAAKEARISELDEELGFMRGDLAMVRETMETMVHNHGELSSILAANDEEISILRGESDNSEELERLRDVDKRHEQVSEEAERWRLEVERLHEVIGRHETNDPSEEEVIRRHETNDLSEDGESKTPDIVRDLEHEIASLSERFEEQDVKMVNQKLEIKTLRDAASKHAADLADLNEEKKTLVGKVQELLKKVTQQESTIQSLQQQPVTNGDEIISYDKNQSTVTNRERLKDKSVIIEPAQNNVIPNGDINSDDLYSTSAALEEIEKFKKIALQKDTVISQLNDNNSSLLSLLEERSQAVYNDDTLLDIHRLETTVSALRLEKDQMMSILNEKTRECSTLKGEVHRLMNVISAEKNALSKLQQDNHELTHARASHEQSEKEKANADMKQEAIKKLSQIIRDKDVEIEGK